MTKVPAFVPLRPHGHHSLFSRIIETVASRTEEENAERPDILECFGQVLKIFINNGFRFRGDDSCYGVRAMLELLSLDESYVRTTFLKAFLTLGAMPNVAIYDEARKECITAYDYVKENAVKVYEERNWDRGDPAHWLEDFRLMRAARRGENFWSIEQFFMSTEYSHQESQQDSTLKSVF